MPAGDAGFRALVDAIVANDADAVAARLADSPELAVAGATAGATRQDARSYFLQPIDHYLYRGDTALHIASAAKRPDLARMLLATGADVGACNRRGAQPLHYAVDASPGSPTWDPAAQAATITVLLEAGADPNAPDRGGTPPLHRAVRNRCSAAVRVLLDRGADPRGQNKRGSTPMALANMSTGRGGSGSPAAQAERAMIVELLEDHGGGT